MPDRLETECRKARLKQTDVCVWQRPPGYNRLYATSCDKLYQNEDFTFCPFCGKKIEVVS
jgi:hypothetical protein